MIWRVLFWIELILLAIPVTFLSSAFAVYAFGRAGMPEGHGNLVILFLATVGLIGFWALAGAYLSAGRSSLARMHWSAWLAATAGVFATLLGLAAEFLEVSTELRGLTWGIAGVPMLIPLAHLLAARFIAASPQQ
jgi:hypothetical protein